MTIQNIVAIIQLLVAFNVPQPTVANVQSILMARYPTQIATAPQPVAVPTTPAPRVPVAETAVAVPEPTPVVVAEPVATPAPVVAEPVQPIAVTPAPKPATPVVTISRGDVSLAKGIGTSLLVAGEHSVQVDSITVMVSGDPAQVLNIRVLVNGVPWQNRQGYFYQSSIKLYPSMVWFGPVMTGTATSGSVTIPAGGSARVEVTADRTMGAAASATVTYLTGHQILSGEAL